MGIVIQMKTFRRTQRPCHMLPQALTPRFLGCPHCGWELFRIIGDGVVRCERCYVEAPLPRADGQRGS
jgi:hypothetical protein